MGPPTKKGVNSEYAVCAFSYLSPNLSLIGYRNLKKLQPKTLKQDPRPLNKVHFSFETRAHIMMYNLNHWHIFFIKLRRKHGADRFSILAAY